MLERMILAGTELIFADEAKFALQLFLSEKGMNTNENYELIAACLFGFAEKIATQTRYTANRQSFSLSFVPAHREHKADDYLLTFELVKIDDCLFYVERLSLTLLNKRVTLGSYET